MIFIMLHRRTIVPIKTVNTRRARIQQFTFCLMVSFYPVPGIFCGAPAPDRGEIVFSREFTIDKIYKSIQGPVGQASFDLLEAGQRPDVPGRSFSVFNQVLNVNHRDFAREKPRVRYRNTIYYVRESDRTEEIEPLYQAPGQIMVAVNKRNAAGIPVFRDHEYALISTYNNTSGEDQDAVAIMYFFLHDKSFQMPGRI